MPHATDRPLFANRDSGRPITQSLERGIDSRLSATKTIPTVSRCSINSGVETVNETTHEHDGENIFRTACS